jgi:hypothetical protein
VSKVLPWVILVALATVLTVISFTQPWMLDDRNSFLKAFVGADYLATLGVIVSITLASAANIHLHLNNLSDDTGTRFVNTRRSIRRSCNSLVLAFVAAIVLVTVKPLLPAAPYNAAMANSIALIIIYFNASIMLDLVRTSLVIPSRNEIKQQDDR